MDNFEEKIATDDDIRELIDIINDVETRLASKKEEETDIFDESNEGINNIKNVLMANGFSEEQAHFLLYGDNAEDIPNPFENDDDEIDESDTINAISNILITDGLPKKDAHALIYDDFEETEDAKSILVPVYISTVAYIKVKDAPSIKDAFEVVDNTKDDIIKVNGLSVLPNTVEIIGTEEFVKQFNSLDTQNIKATDVEFK